MANRQTTPANGRRPSAGERLHAPGGEAEWPRPPEACRRKAGSVHEHPARAFRRAGATQVRDDRSFDLGGMRVQMTARASECTLEDIVIAPWERREHRCPICVMVAPRRTPSLSPGPSPAHRNPCLPSSSAGRTVAYRGPGDVAVPKRTPKVKTQPHTGCSVKRSPVPVREAGQHVLTNKPVASTAKP